MFEGVFAPNPSIQSHVFSLLGLTPLTLESSGIGVPLVLPPGLSLQNDYWFNHLRGIAPAHEHVSYIGALSQQNGNFDALPLSEFYLLMAYSFSASRIKQMKDPELPPLIGDSFDQNISRLKYSPVLQQINPIRPYQVGR